MRFYFVDFVVFKVCEVDGLVFFLVYRLFRIKWVVFRVCLFIVGIRMIYSVVVFWKVLELR